MLLLFLIKVTEWPPVLERAVHSANCAFVKLCVCPFSLLVLKVG